MPVETIFGVVAGDKVVQVCGFEWIILEGESVYRISPALTSEYLINILGVGDKEMKKGAS